MDGIFFISRAVLLITLIRTIGSESNHYSLKTIIKIENRKIEIFENFHSDDSLLPDFFFKSYSEPSNPSNHAGQWSLDISGQARMSCGHLDRPDCK